jgi:hypothetical protein
MRLKGFTTEERRPWRSTEKYKRKNVYRFLLYDEAGLAGEGLVAADDSEVDTFAPAGNI